MSAFGAPGVGGSLGTCCLCGENFVREIMSGALVNEVHVTGVESAMYAHDLCLASIDSKSFDVTTLPEKSPLRRAYEESRH